MRSRRFYWAAVTHVDEQVGEVIKALRRRNLLENTLIVYTADHGDMMGDHFHWRKCTPYEGSTRIPMVLKWPDTWKNISLPRGSFLYNPVELRDLFPTFLDAARIPIPAQVPKMDGKSMVLLLQERFSEWREWLDLEHDDCYGPLNRWNAITDGHWKYVYRAAVNKELLWNLDDDPEERFNLANDPNYKDEVEKWRSRLVKQFEEEKRGSDYVAKGELVHRKSGRTFSPHYDRPDYPRYYWRPKNKLELLYGVLSPGDFPARKPLLGRSTKSLGDSSSSSSSPSLPPRPLAPKLFFFFLSSAVAIIAVKGKKIYSLLHRT